MRRQQLVSRLRYHLRLAPVHQASRRCSGPGETRYPFVCSLYATDASQTQAGSLSYASAITTRQLPRYAGCHGTSVAPAPRLPHRPAQMLRPEQKRYPVAANPYA